MHNTRRDIFIMIADETGSDIAIYTVNTEEISRKKLHVTCGNSYS